MIFSMATGTELSPHAAFSFPGGDLFIAVETTLFCVHKDVVATRIMPLHDVLGSGLPQPAEGAEGITAAKPIHLSGVTTVEFEAFLQCIYDVNMHIDPTPKPVHFWLGVRRLSDMWEWPQLTNYAMKQVTNADNGVVDPFQKLLLGYKYGVMEWVVYTLRSIYFRGSKIAQAVNKDEFGGTYTVLLKFCSSELITFAVVLTSDELHFLNWTLRDGSALIDRTISELIQDCPRMSSADDDDWSCSKCDNHQRCVKALSAGWNHVRTHLSGLARDGKCGLSWDLMDSIERYQFNGMDPRCRVIVMRDLSCRLIEFYHRICQAVADRILGLDLPVESDV
ncbi:hypothetical protein D9758_015410 [Tetrapyrgos nigripes]|uniref:BTB domain-containing protein n=1 Tax=Tetrapyrgos nigripes TaxID=182062 RepID=A0A8H5FN48_9AGAR|nr:hypothetical protein D9758_015410 [Tetrapyrgos nigripes]